MVLTRILQLTTMYLKEEGKRVVMKENITRKLDELGRIVIPSDFRKKLDVKTGDRLRVELVDNTLILQKSIPTCVLCGKAEDLNYESHNKYICEDCLETILMNAKK